MHLSSYMFKNALLNAKETTKNDFLKSLKKAVKKLIEEENISLKDCNLLDDKTLFQFSIPTKSNSDLKIYFIALQTIRLAGLMHDIGHAPFSHQIEYALKKLYNNLRAKEINNYKEFEFLEYYNGITNNSEEIYHEAIGDKFIEVLFNTELTKISDKNNQNSTNRVILKLLNLIFSEKTYEGFNFKTLHKFIDSTVDADRLDYINRDMLASGYLSGATDFFRIVKNCVLVKKEDNFNISFYDVGLIDIEHMLEMRFNLYKKVIFNHNIAKKDALLESVILYLSQKYFDNFNSPALYDSISMLWKFLEEKSADKLLDNISMLDENWLMTLFKKEYFLLKEQNELKNSDKKYLYCFEEILFGKRFFKSIWKNLNEFYNILEFDQNSRYKFRESFGYITEHKLNLLQKRLDNFIQKYEDKNSSVYFSYQIVSFKIGIDKEFSLYDGKKEILLDEVSTLRQRLKKSMSNTVPFFIYSNKQNLSNPMKDELKEILFDIFLE